MSLTRWMANLSPDIKLRDLAIPGTHDSATSNISFRRDFTTEAYLPSALISAGKALPCVKHIIANWAKAQSLSITQQLEAGIRYLDLRVVWNPIENEIYTSHSLYDKPINEILNEIKQFLESNPTEVIFLDFQNFHGFTELCHTRFMDLVSFIFQTKIAPNDLGPDVTIKTLRANNQQIIMFHQSPPADFNHIIWNRESRWLNKQTVSELQKDLETELSHAPENLFSVLQSIITPDTDMIVKGILGCCIPCCPSSLEDAAEETNPVIISWLESKAKKPNIVIMDFFKPTEIKQIIELNTHPEKAHNVAKSPADDKSSISTPLLLT